MTTDEQKPTMPAILYSLVAIGASAGGIEALSTVLGALPKDFALPIVVAQHLDPARPSHLDAILARRTALTVCLVTDSTPLLPATVYVVPSDRDIEITDQEVHVRAGSSTLATPSINRLLSSAALAYGERLIGAILTGTGSDGAQGAREVKAAGGLVMIENPATAAFGGMPRSLAPTTVDIVADLDQIGPLLCDLSAGTYIPAVPLSPNPDPEQSATGAPPSKRSTSRTRTSTGSGRRSTRC
jgi:two-component system, chemotaxis family, CheB/CheR fusion protein